MPSEDARAVKKEEAEEDNKSLSSFVKKKPTNANNGGSRKLKKEELNDDNKPIKSSLSRSLPKGLGDQFQTTDAQAVKTLNFLSDVKKTFHDEPAKLKKFVKIQVDFKAHRFDEATTLAKLVQLMKGHDHLLRAFVVLIPQANITVPPAPHDHKRKRAHQSDEAADFMNKRKTKVLEPS